MVSATNVDLVRRVKEGRFRLDLWYRLEVQPLFVPPLRERGGDALCLLHHFLRREGGPGGRPPRLSREAEDVIVRFRWPGNVRQLATEAQRLAVKASAGVVELSHLSAEVLEGPRVASGSLRRNREESDRNCVRKALEQHGGNRTAAAAHLGISRQALVSLIRRLELRIPATRDRVVPSPSTDLERAT